MQKKLKLLLIMILFLSLISAVNAHDVNSTDVNSSDDKLNVVNDYNLGIPQEELENNSSNLLQADNPSQKVKSTPVISIETRNVKSKDSLKIFLKDKDGKALKSKKLTVNINKKTMHLKTNSKGVANLKIDLPAKKYKLTASFTGDDKYNSRLKTFNIKVSKLSTKIIRFSNFVLNKHYFYVFLRDSSGNPVPGKKVTFRCNGKTDSRIANKNGRVGIRITSLHYARYSISYRFNGDNYYAPTSKKVSVYVNHYTSLCLVNSKLLKNGYLRITLKDSSTSVSKKNIKIKIGNKVFHKKTNSDGMVVFKPKMDVKKYLVLVKFGRYYVSKTINCYDGKLKDPLREVIPLKGGIPDIDVMPGKYVWADGSGTYTLTRAQYREVLIRDSHCLYLHNKLPKYVFFKTKSHPNTYYIIKREKWNVIEKEINRKLVNANKFGYWPSSVTVSLKGKAYKYYEVRDIQDTGYTCGPTSCSMCSQVLKHYLPEYYISYHSGTTSKDGTACSGMIKTLDRNNFNCTYFYRNTFSHALEELAKGGCALVFHTKNHYVAILDISPNGKQVLVSNSYGSYYDIPSKWLSVSYMKTRFYKNYDDGLIVKLKYNLSKSKIHKIDSYYYSMAPNWNCHNTHEIVT